MTGPEDRTRALFAEWKATGDAAFKNAHPEIKLVKQDGRSLATSVMSSIAAVCFAGSRFGYQVHETVGDPILTTRHPRD